jgi:HPt (histidine-containing phosphotransfer) domain-containing protein
VIQLFLKHVPDQIASIQDAVERDDPKLLKERAHKLKGSANAVGARVMGGMCAELESHPADAAQVAHLLKDEYDQVEVAMLTQLREREGMASP